MLRDANFSQLQRRARAERRRNKWIVNWTLLRQLCHRFGLKPMLLFDVRFYLWCALKSCAKSLKSYNKFIPKWVVTSDKLPRSLKHLPIGWSFVPQNIQLFQMHLTRQMLIRTYAQQLIKPQQNFLLLFGNLKLSWLGHILLLN